jgi:hypothetical protein
VGAEEGRRNPSSAFAPDALRVRGVWHGWPRSSAPHFLTNSEVPVHVVFDVDGVLRNLMGTYVGALDPPRDVEEIISYSTAVEMAGNVDSFYQILNDNDCWLRAAPHAHMLDIYREIERLGCKISAVSFNPDPKGRLDTLKWLTKLDILFDGIHFCPDKLALQFDAIIEDSPQMAYDAALAGRGAFLVHRPWTRCEERRHVNLFKLPPDEEAKDPVLDIIRRNL